MSKVLLMEGYQAEWAEQTVYITDTGSRLRINESKSAFITEDGNAVKFGENDIMVMEKTGDKLGTSIVAIEGVFQRCDTRNANGRIYPRSLFERILKENSPAMARLNGRGMVCHLEHPSDGITDLKKIAAVVTGLKLREDGVMWGRCEILKTSDGLQARALLEGRVRVGMSSRGRGTVRQDGVVNDDYELETFDLVYNPSTPGAYPTANESAKGGAKNESASALPNTQKPHQELPMTFNALQFESSVRPLLDQPAANLQPYQRGEMLARVQENIASAMSAIKADSTIGTVVAPVIAKLQAKAAEIEGLPQNEATALKTKVEELEKALKTANEAKDAATKRADAAVKLAESLTTAFETRQAAAAESLATMKEALEDANESAGTEEPTDLADAYAELRAAHEAALSVIETLVQKQKVRTVASAVESAITAHPFLKASQAVLEAAKSPEAVDGLVESITQAMGKGNTPDSQRPRGKNVVSEGGEGSSQTGSEGGKGKPTMSKGAALAQTLGESGKL